MSETADNGFGLRQIGQVAVPVSDLERSIAFYRDVLGMKFLFQAPPGLGFFDCSGVRLLLDQPPQGEKGGGSSIIYYKVPDLQVACQMLKGRGVTFEKEPELVARMSDHEVWMAFLRDPDQNLLALMSEVPLQAK